jgi:hypothetical protein
MTGSNAMAESTTAQVGTPATQTTTVKHTNDVLAGANIALFVVAAILFLRFYRKTTDRLFAFFALAFFILGINGTIFQFFDSTNEARTYLYAVRAVAFSVIIYAIVDKNLMRRRIPARKS